MVDLLVWSPCSACSFLAFQTSWASWCHSWREYCDASSSSPCLVRGSLIHCLVSASHLCRMIAWSGCTADPGGVARYHVGGMYPRSPERAWTSHSSMDRPGGCWVNAFSLSVVCCTGMFSNQWFGLKHLAHFCTTVVTEESVFVRVVLVHVVKSCHWEQQEVHEWLLASVALLHLLIWLDSKILS